MNELTEKFIKLLSAKGYVFLVMDKPVASIQFADGTNREILSRSRSLVSIDEFFTVHPDPKGQIIFFRSFDEVPLIAGGYLDNEYNLVVPKEDVIFTKSLKISYDLIKYFNS